MLTKQHRKLIFELARDRTTSYLFVSPSLSSKSYTLRYKQEWHDRAGYYHYQTSMVFTVRHDESKFNQMVIEAKELFNQFRIEKEYGRYYTAI